MENYKNEKDNLLTGSFKNRSSAEQAYNRLLERGYTDDQINVIMSDETRKNNFDKNKNNESDFGNKSME